MAVRFHPWRHSYTRVWWKVSKGVGGRAETINPKIVAQETVSEVKQKADTLLGTFLLSVSFRCTVSPGRPLVHRPSCPIAVSQLAGQRFYISLIIQTLLRFSFGLTEPVGQHQKTASHLVLSLTITAFSSVPESHKVKHWVVCSHGDAANSQCSQTGFISWQYRSLSLLSFSYQKLCVHHLL